MTAAVPDTFTGYSPALFPLAEAVSPSTVNSFPFTVYEPNVTATYESEGYGAMLWAMKNATTSELPHYYLVRPTTDTIVSGEINFYVHGKWTA